MKVAQLRRFDAANFKTPVVVSPSKEFFEVTTTTGGKVDFPAYKKAILDFITELGPQNLISLTTPGVWYRWSEEKTDVWYWKEVDYVDPVLKGQ